MKTATSYIGEVSILGHRMRVQFGQPTDESGKSYPAEQDDDQIAFRENLCGRAIVNHAAGLANLLLRNAGNNVAEWIIDGRIKIGTSLWTVRIVKRLPPGMKGKGACVIHPQHEIQILRRSGGEMALVTMESVELVWKYWQMRLVKAALNAMPEQLIPDDCAAWQDDWEAVKAKLEAA